MRLNLRQVEAFRHVYQTASMTVAGELMGVSQPAISRLIRDLEAEVGFALFERTRGRLTPTADAAEFFREVERSFHGLDRIARAAAELRQRRVGDLRVVSTVAMSFYLFPEVLRCFRAGWPDIRLALHSCPSPEAIDCVASRQYDVGVVVAPADPPGVAAIPLPRLDMVCVLPEGHRLARRAVVRPEDLDGQPLLVISSYSTAQHKVMQGLEAAGARPDVVMEATNSAPICDLVAAGAGVSVLEPVTPMAFVGRGVVVRPYAPAIPLEFRFIHASNRPLSDRARAFLDLVTEAMARFAAAEAA